MVTRKDMQAAMWLRPKKRGNMLCFLYWPSMFGNEPLLTLGPDYRFSIGELIAYNVAMAIIVSRSGDYATYTAILGLMQNCFYLLTVFWNNGMVDRNPRKHDIAYL